MDINWCFFTSHHTLVMLLQLQFTTVTMHLLVASRRCNQTLKDWSWTNFVWSVIIVGKEDLRLHIILLICSGLNLANYHIFRIKYTQNWILILQYFQCKMQSIPENIWAFHEYVFWFAITILSPKLHHITHEFRWELISCQKTGKMVKTKTLQKRYKFQNSKIGEIKII